MQPEALKILVIGVGAMVLFLGSIFGYIAYLKRVAPAASDATQDVTGSDADKRFAKLDGHANLLFMLLTLVCGVLAYLVVYAIDSVRVMLLPQALMTYPMSHAFLYMVAGVAGAGLASMMFAMVVRWRWGEDARWYLAYASVRRYGCNYERLCRGLGFGLVALAALALPLGLNVYVQVRDASFVVHPFFALHERVYAYGDIRSIETASKFIAPNGRIRDGRDYVVHFSDGGRWVAADLPSGDGYDRSQVVTLLAKRAGVTITEVPIFKTSDVYD